MAVLAGTVAGATVSILNKKTDQINYEFNGKAIAARVAEWAGEVLDNPPYFYTLTGLAFEDGLPETDEQWQIYAAAAYNVLPRNFSSLSWKETYGLPEKKGQFGADIIDMSIYIFYKGKTKDYAEVYYRLSLTDDGRIITEKGEAFPT